MRGGAFLGGTTGGNGRHGLAGSGRVISGKKPLEGTKASEQENGRVFGKSES